MKLYYDKEGFHNKQNETNTRYETNSEYQLQLVDYINNNPNREDVFRIVPDVNGKPIVIEIEIDFKAIYRRRREQECFPIINRGYGWYKTLTPQQELELEQWYQAWLNVTDTLIVPVKPAWLY